MPVTSSDIQAAIRNLHLSGNPVCVHASLKSFGPVDGGAEAVAAAFISEDCTLLVPSFSWAYATYAPKHLRPERNGTDAAYLDTLMPTERIYTPDASEIDTDMGAIAAAVMAHPNRWRGDHPLCSFTAVGPLAKSLTCTQTAENVYAPLGRLTDMNGYILLIGVDLTSMTFLHYTEQEAGRTLFRRWANNRQGEPMMVTAGGCSGGFGQFKSVLQGIRQPHQTGRSLWQCYPAKETLQKAVDAIRKNPMITHCDNPSCGRCNDAVAGGPIL